MRCCEGLRVVECGHGMAVGLVGMVLADYGAEVVKLEPPGGDSFRGEAGFLVWNRNKRSAVVDFDRAEDRAWVGDLVAGADVVVDGLGVEDRLGGRLDDSNPRLVFCSITGFGRSSRFAGMKGYEGVVAAKAGRMANFAGVGGRSEPVFSAVPAGCFSAAQLALQGIFGALYVRERAGVGQRVETSLLSGLSVLGGGGWAGGEVFAFLAYLSGRTKDGHWLQLANTSPHLFRALLRCLDLEAVLDEDRYRGAPMLVAPADVAELRARMLERLAQRTLAEWLELFDAVGNVGAEPFLTAEEALSHPQMLHNGHVVEIDDPRVGRLRTVGPLVAFAGDAGAPARAAPSLGAAGRPSWSEPAMAAAPTAALPPHALDGITVLELATYMAAPLGPTLLADLGARVVKVEPLSGDPMRMIVPSPVMVNGVQGKESIAIDLKTEEGREVLHRLIRRCDALVHNYRPGIPEKLGIDYETVRALNPRIVYLYAGAYGEDGPTAHRPAFHPTAGAVSGGALHQAASGSPPPPDVPLTETERDAASRHLSLANEGSPDPCAALVVGTALLMGLLARERSGTSQRLMTTMLCSNAYANADGCVVYDGKPPRPRPDAGLHGLSALYRLYRAAEGWVFLACLTAPEWDALVAEAGFERLREERFATAEGRSADDGDLAKELERIFRAAPADEWEERLGGAGVPCVRADLSLLAPALGGGSGVPGGDAVLLEEGLRVEVSHPAAGPYLRHGIGPRLSRTPGVARPGCALGEHTRSLLAELGYGAAEVEALLAGRVVGAP